VSPRVIITGAAGGIGGEAVAALRAKGASVVGLDLRAEGEEILACDVRDQASVDSAVATAVERLGGLDVLINCAGIGDPQSAGEAPGEDAERVLAVNLLGPWRVTAAALPALLESPGRGRVVNVSSGLAYIAMPFGVAYCMSKRGLVAYSDALRAEYGDLIDVTTVYPGYIRTPIHEASVAKGLTLEGLVPAEPVRAAAAALVRAALGPPVRDLATTRRGTISYAALRHAPRRLIDAGLRRSVRRAARKGVISGDGLAAEMHARLTAGP
jgi:NAD(P)-dependent dehydrogenase (short-subunit alcohol dehydrogenase family)